MNAARPYLVPVTLGVLAVALLSAVSLPGPELVLTSTTRAASAWETLPTLPTRAPHSYP